MEQTLHQLGELLLGSVPTIVLLGLLYLSYRLILHGPLERTLAERRARTEGAIEKARADIAISESRTAEYEQRLRDARSAIFRAQEQRRQQALKAREAALAEARAMAQAQIKAAREALENDKVKAKADLQAEIERLAQQIIHAVLQPAGSSPASGVR
jgi:F-type H+-transporting ATPase subunit b